MAAGDFGELVAEEPYGDYYGNVVAEVGGGDVLVNMWRGRSREVPTCGTVNRL